MCVCVLYVRASERDSQQASEQKRERDADVEDLIIFRPLLHMNEWLSLIHI